MNINNAIAKAQRLMLDPEFNRQVEFAAKNPGGGGQFQSSNDLAGLEAQAGFGAPAPSFSPQGNVPQYQRQQMPPQPMRRDNSIEYLQETTETRDLSQSRLPKEILESFKQMPPLTGDDSLEMPPASFYGNSYQQQQPRQQINEQFQQPMQQAPYAPQSNAIDYNYISHLVNEAVTKAMTQTNESIVRGLRIGNGGKIQFIDSKGNLYEGTLTLKKKAGQK